MEHVSRLVERLGVDHIDDEERAEHKANQHGGGGHRQHDPLLHLLLLIKLVFIFLPGDLLTWEDILALVKWLPGVREKKGGASSRNIYQIDC